MLKKLTKVGLIMLALFLVLTSEIRAQDIKDEFIARMKSYNSQVNSIASDFIQQRSLSIMEDVLVSSGEFFYKKPGLMKWDQQQPSEYYFILNGDKVIRFDGKKKKTIPANSPQVAHFKDFIIGAVNGSIFENKLYETEINKNGNRVMVILMPQQKAMSKRIEKIHLEFDYEKMILLNLILFEADGDKTTIHFSNQQINTITDLSIFNPE